MDVVEVSLRNLHMLTVLSPMSGIDVICRFSIASLQGLRFVQKHVEVAVENLHRCAHIPDLCDFRYVPFAAALSLSTCLKETDSLKHLEYPYKSSFS